MKKKKDAVLNALLKRNDGWMDQTIEDGPIIIRRNIEFRWNYSLSFVVIDCDGIINLMIFFSYVAWPRADWTVDWFKNDLDVFYCFVILFRCRMHASVPPKISSIQCSEEDRRAPLHPDKEVLVIVKTKAAEFISALYFFIPCQPRPLPPVSSFLG